MSRYAILLLNLGFNLFINFFWTWLIIINLSWALKHLGFWMNVDNISTNNAFFLSLKKVHKLKSMSPTNNQLQKEIQTCANWKKQVDKRIYPVFGDNMGVCVCVGGGGCAIITSKNTTEYIHYKRFKSVNNVLSVLEGWSFLNHTLGFLLHLNLLTLL